MVCEKMKMKKKDDGGFVEGERGVVKPAVFFLIS